MVTTFYPPYSFGGDGVFVHSLAQALAERGHHVEVVHSVDAYRLQHASEPEQCFAEHPNVRRHELRSRWPRLAALGAHQLGAPAGYGAQLRALLEGDRFDVIHFHNVSLMGAPGVLGLGRAVKLYTPHEYWLICPTHVLFKFNREACRTRHCLSCTLHARRPPQLWRYGQTMARATRHVHRFLMPSRFALEQHRGSGLEAPMTVLPNFVPAPSAKTVARVAERRYFLFVGRLEKLKGVQDLLRLFRSYRAADLLIIGDGAYRQELEQRARGLSHVKFVGALHPGELGAYYRGAVAVLVPSLCYEVFPLIPVEALSHGTPVITRRLGALTEVVEESGGGFLFDTLEECRTAMERLLQDPELRRELGERGRRTALANWTTDVHLTRYLGIVEELL